MSKPVRAGAVWFPDLFLPSSGLMIGDIRLISKRDPNGNIDFFLAGADGREVNLTGETLFCRCTANATNIGTSAASLTGDGDSSKVRLLLPTIGEWLVGVAVDIQVTSGAAGSCVGALYVNDSGSAETGVATLNQAVVERATVGQRWKVTTTAANTPVELKVYKTGAGGTVNIMASNTTLTATIGAGGGSTVETTDHGTLTGRGDDDHPQYGQLADAETVPGVWDFTGGLKTDTISESTGAAGVTIDSVLLKDGVVAVGDVGFDDATSNPLPTHEDTPADGTENSVARKDHVHALGGTAGGDLGGTYPNPSVDDGADSTAIHDNVANEITALVQVTPAADDEFVVEDNSDGYNKKAVLFSALEGALTHDSLIAGTVADHDTGATGAELDTLTDGSNADVGPLHTHDTLAAKVQFRFSITVEDPTSSEDITITFTNKAVTITEMRAVLIGTANGQTVTWTIRHHASDRSNAGNEVVTNGTATTSLTTGSDVTAFNDATIPADSFIWLETTAKGGTVTELHVTGIGTYD